MRRRLAAPRQRALVEGVVARDPDALAAHMGEWVAVPGTDVEVQLRGDDPVGVVRWRRVEGAR